MQQGTACLFSAPFHFTFLPPCFAVAAVTECASMHFLYPAGTFIVLIFSVSQAQQPLMAYKNL
jgi:hypothetical protein